MINLKKNSGSPNLLSALGLEKMEQKLMKEKLEFLKRLANNDLTKNILEELERFNGETKKLSNKSNLKKIAEYLECDELDFDVLIPLLNLKLKEISKKSDNGIIIIEIKRKYELAQICCLKKLKTIL
ncbi:hypothetical protein BpHYR1_042801 [Brachionus plicatilis]|uniref:Uncharacterized protein n=1 Tax=Brachionus plicatilis TaxID=10195 RepID=A0A3M7SQA7_BRAPC|nr:hypothetical protein BpHYR1_042801 [Brachionus plicatilis]